MKIGFMELVLVFVVALLVIGPDKLPSFAQKLGKALQEFRKASADVTKDVRENVIEPLEEAQKPIREALEPLEELDKEIRGDLKDMEKSIQNIGKPAPRKQEEHAEPAPEAAPAPEGEEPIAEPAEEIEESTGGERE